MCKNPVKRSFAALVFGFMFSLLSFSQVDNIDFLRAGPVDGAKILEAYVTPWANAFGAGVNGSWYNTAKPHKLGGFDLTLSANFGFAPSSDNTFDVSKIGLTTFTGSGMAPTISGKKTGMQKLTGPICRKCCTGHIQNASRNRLGCNACTNLTGRHWIAIWK